MSLAEQDITSLVTPEGLEGGSRELQAHQSDLGAGEGHGTDHLQCHHGAHMGQTGDQAQSVWAVRGKSCLSNLICGKGKAVNVST